MMPKAERRTAESEEERVGPTHSTPIAKVIEIIGNSPHSFEDAIERALNTASQSVRHIMGLEVRRMSVIVDHNRVAEYRVDLKLAFGIEPHGEAGAH